MGIYTKTILAPLSDPPGETHIPPEDIARFVEGRMTTAERDPLLAHLNRCPTCMEIAAATMECLPAPAAVGVPRSLPRTFYALAASVLVILAGLGVFQWRDASQPIVATLELDAALRAIIMESSAANWAPGERTERLAALLEARGVAAKKMQQVALAAPYHASKSFLGPKEFLKITIKGDTALLEIVTQKE